MHVSWKPTFWMFVYETTDRAFTQQWLTESSNTIQKPNFDYFPNHLSVLPISDLMIGISMYTHNIHSCTCIYTCIYVIHIYTCIFIHIYIYICTYIYIFTHYICLHECADHRWIREHIQSSDWWRVFIHGYVITLVLNFWIALRIHIMLHY